jgi:hypothetical protein
MGCPCDAHRRDALHNKRDQGHAVPPQLKYIRRCQGERASRFGDGTLAQWSSYGGETVMAAKVWMKPIACSSRSDDRRTIARQPD